MVGIPWTVESDFIVREMCASNFTGHQIADRLCLLGWKKSRNAVLGYMYRKGIPAGRPSSRTTSAANMAVKKAKKRQLRKEIKPLPTIFDKELKFPDMQYLKDPEFNRETGIPLESLEPHECRWPVTNTKPVLFCGDKACEGKSYCELHQKLAYKKPNQKL